MALQRLIAQGVADANGNITGLTDPSWVPPTQYVFTGSLSIPDSTITAQWSLIVNQQPQLTFIGQSVVTGVQIHLLDNMTLSATGLTPGQIVQAVFLAVVTPEDNTQVSSPTVTPTGTTQNAGNLQFLAGSAIPVPGTRGLILDLTQVIYPANTLLANYNTALCFVNNTTSGPVIITMFGHSSFDAFVQTVTIPTLTSYVFAIPIIGFTQIDGLCNVVIGGGVFCSIMLTEEVIPSPDVLGWDSVDSATGLVPLNVDAAGNLNVNASLTIANPLPVATVSATLASSPYGQTSVGTVATAIAGVHTERTGLTVKLAQAATAPVFLGTDASVTTANGYLLEAGNSITTSEPGQIYGIVATGTQTVYWEDE
jgi:hypothetical protein